MNVIISNLSLEFPLDQESDTRIPTDLMASDSFNAYCKSSRLQMLYKIGVLNNFARFTGKHLRWSLFLNKVGRSQACIFITKETPTQVSSCEFYEIFKNTFLTEHLRWLLL